MPRRYYGWNVEEHRVMIATMTGNMDDGTAVYTECDAEGNLIDLDKQYQRTLRHGGQNFFRI